MHLVFGVARLHLGGAAGVLQGVDAVAQALVRQRREVIPPGGAVRDAVQHTAGLGVAAVHDEVARRLQFGRVRAVEARPALLLVAAEPEPKTERVEPEIPVAVLLAVALLAVALLIAAVVEAAIALLLAVGVAVAAVLGAGLPLGDGVVGRLHFLEVLFGRGVVGVQVGVPALALGTIGFFDFFLAGSALDAQHLIGVFHGSTSSRLYELARPCCRTNKIKCTGQRLKNQEKPPHSAVLGGSFACLQLYLSQTPE